MKNNPNILMISIDSLRRDYCTFYNRSENTTPFLNKFSDDCTVFNKAISPSTWTLPVHNSIFTGLYPKEHGVTDKGISVKDHPRIAEVLSNNGYVTKSFGYNGWLRQGNTLNGWDHTTTSPSPSGITGYPVRGINKLKRLAFHHPPPDNRTVNKAVNEINSIGDEQFAFFIHLQGAHYKYQPHISDYREFSDGSQWTMYKTLKSQKEIYDNRLNRYRINNHADKIEDGLIEEIKNMYRGEILRVDRLISNLITSLKDSSTKLDNTIVIIFADHGESFGENGIYGHNFSVDDSLIRVPLLIFDPTETLSDGVRNDIVQLNDLYQTVAEFCGVNVPKTKSISMISGEREAAYSHYIAADSMYNDVADSIQNIGGVELPPKEIYTIWKSDERKLIWSPDEQLNSGTLHNQLREHLDGIKSIPTDNNTTTSKQVLKNLEDMGYL